VKPIPAPSPAATVPGEFAVLLACLGFREDRHGLRRSTACNLLRGRCALWPATDPLTARAERVAGHPAAILARTLKRP
jgi:hypothetical protein